MQALNFHIKLTGNKKIAPELEARCYVKDEGESI
jgi:hypothetical protein